MKTEAKKRLPQLFQMATLTFASVILLACDGDVTGPERDQSDPPASEAAVGSVTGFVTSLGWPAAAVPLIITQDGVGIQATTTGPDGEYSFHGLPVGDYDIQLLNRKPFDALSRGAIWSVSVYSGTNVLDLDLFEKWRDGTGGG